MGDERGSRPRRGLLTMAFAGTLAIAGGCLPQSNNDDDSGKQPLMSFGGSGGSSTVNRSEKADPLAQVSATARNLLAVSDGPPRRQESVQTVSRDERAVSAVPPSAQLPSAEIPAAQVPAAAFTAAGEIEDTPAATALDGFFKQLSDLENDGATNAVTILHLGDSHIAADRFSGDLREQFQSRFGNAGRGMVMPGLYMARGVKFDQGGNWQAALSIGGTPGPYGITGVKVTGKTREDWLRLTTTDRTFGWAEITLQTGPGQGSAIIALDDETKQVSLAGPALGWRTVRLERQTRELMVRPKGDGPITLHALVTGEQRPGVRYVNLGLPGATAVTPLAWTPGQIAHDLKQMAPGLIVVGYGTEESFDDELEIRAYETKAAAMLSMLQQAAPQASLVVIGPPDVARLPKFAGAGARSSDVCRALSPQERAGYAQRIRAGDQRFSRWHPPLRLEEVRQALRRVAAAHRAYFWDWSKIMGGACGIHAWVHSDPPLAAGDHVHLTEEGSKRSARLFFRELMAGYDTYDRAVVTGQAGLQPTAIPAAPPSTAPRKAR